MDFESENPFFLSFTDVLTCVLGGSVALFLIFVVMVKLAPAQQASTSATSPRDAVAMALAREPADARLPAVLQIVSLSSGDCGVVRSIGVELPDVELWDFTTRTANGDHRCGKLVVFKAGLPVASTVVTADRAPGTALRISLSVGASTWSPLVRIDPVAFTGMKGLMRIGSRLSNIISFATRERISRTFEEDVQG